MYMTTFDHICKEVMFQGPNQPGGEGSSLSSTAVNNILEIVGRAGFCKVWALDSSQMPNQI
jgi:hypothetical protein